MLVEVERLEKQLQEREEEEYMLNLHSKLKEVMKLKEIMPQLLHSLVSSSACKSDGTVTIQYNFVNPFQET